ncbi:MAG: GreA/GreB family elongation factor [Kiritimatiellae bacterium]|nr:GreA/GreB family elongation factor [Kiritimatiellia bacterium]
MQSTPDSESYETGTEEWFMQRIFLPDPPLDELIHVLDGLVEQGGCAQADERARVLQDELFKRQAVDDALRVFHWRAGLLPPGSGSMTRLRDEILGIFREDAPRHVRASQAGWEKPIAPAEAARRLRVILALEEGSLCLERSWGFGVVQRLDDLARKVEIDFERNSGAQLTYGYAAEGLTLLGPDHLLARWHHDRAAVEAMTNEHPGEIVRIALRSFGPMIPDQIKRQLCPRIIAEDAWKKFWDGARRELKKDPRMVMPSKRTEPWVLHAARERFGGEWFEELAVERDLLEILDMAAQLASESRIANLDPDARAILADRLRFVVRGADSKRPGLPAEAVLRATEAGMADEEFDAPQAMSAWKDDEGLMRALRALPAREMEPFLVWMRQREGMGFLDRLRGLLPRMEITPLNAAMDLLLNSGADDADTARVFREAVQAQNPTVEMLLWLQKNSAHAERWAVARPGDLARFSLTAIEGDYMGERLKARNQLRDRFDRAAELQRALDDMSAAQREEFMLRVKASPAWPVLERQAVVGHMVRLYPQLEQRLISEGAAAIPAEPPKMRRTSLRSYHARQRQLHTLVTVDIPQNSRDIGHARSYGDLRENFEYKAAKEAQAVLMRRQSELEQMLRETQPTDFRDADTTRVGPGTRVEIETDTGREVYHILGAWDRDEALRIISCESKLAQSLEGLEAGAEAMAPSDAGERRIRIVSIEPLSPELLEWASSDEPAVS